MANTISLKEYLQLPRELAGKEYADACFEIPSFQRGYIWGKPNPMPDKDNSVVYMLKTLTEGLNSGADMFLQGITYSVRADMDAGNLKVVIIDGQQRTTFFYLLLKFLGYNEEIGLNYTIRSKSNQYLAELTPEVIASLSTEDEDDDYQDIFFFKRTLRLFRKEISDDMKPRLLDYILNHVKFLCVRIPKEQEEIVFTMMNGNKSTMREEEIIKAELLRRASIHTAEIKKVESSEIRGRMAREWDEWLHWWNDKKVSEFFLSSDYVLGWLLPLTLKNENITYRGFIKAFDPSQPNKVKEAKDRFRQMRLMQRQIQDAYNNPLTYNYIGAVLRMRDKSERFNFLRWYFSDSLPKPVEELRRYFDLTVIGVPHRAIIDNNTDVIKKRFGKFNDNLTDPLLYRTAYETGARWLLRCNVLADCDMTGSDTNDYQKGRKFNFEIWNRRSLEHISPKTFFGHTNEQGQLLNWKDEIMASCEIRREGADGEPDINEHSIGNLVLLYGTDNSTFGAKLFEKKKAEYFSLAENARHFESTHLLHTIKVFARSEWNRVTIHERCLEEAAELRKCYSSYIPTLNSEDQ